MRPPITTVARGRCTSEPGPVLKAIGIKPRLATRAVMSTGRSLSADPSTIRSLSFPSLLLRSSLMWSISTSPLSTATPNRATNPMLADTERYIPRIQSRKTPPDRAKGRLSRIRMAYFILPKFR